MRFFAATQHTESIESDDTAQSHTRRQTVKGRFIFQVNAVWSERVSTTAAAAAIVKHKVIKLHSVRERDHLPAQRDTRRVKWAQCKAHSIDCSRDLFLLIDTHTKEYTFNAPL